MESVILLIYQYVFLLLIAREVVVDAKKISTGKLDNKTVDVIVMYFAMATSTFPLIACKYDVMIPVRLFLVGAAMRYAFFDDLLNAKRGVGKWYYGERSALDRFHKWISLSTSVFAVTFMRVFSYVLSIINYYTHVI